MDMTLPKIISVDDHVVEPPDLWQKRLPRKFRDRGPKVIRRVGRVHFHDGKHHFLEDDDPANRPADIWIYEDLFRPMTLGYAYAGHEGKDAELPMTYDEMHPGCYDPAARLKVMDENHTDAQLNYPTVSRFCGQTFLEAKDKEVAAACIRVYNDWMIDEWCGGDRRGRNIPITIVPLWDPEAAAAEVRRCADKGSHAIAFSEGPTALGLPSIHSGHWDVLFQACEETETVINMHIGSSSRSPNTSPDAPLMVMTSLLWQNLMHAFLDWVTSGKLERFPRLKIVLVEGQVGWMPFVLERLDSLWERRDSYGGASSLAGNLTKSPRQCLEDRVFGCVFDDVHGLKSRDQIGMKQIMFETDFPHTDGTWPNSAAVLSKLVTEAGLNEEETYMLARGNAIRCYGLERFGIEV